MLSARASAYLQAAGDRAVFPPMVTRKIAVGEETGDIDGMLTKIAEFYESEVDAAVKALTSIIEPLMVSRRRHSRCHSDLDVPAHVRSSNLIE